MNITKLGHCCLLLKPVENGKMVTIMTDPGFFTIDAVKSVVGVDIILITHEHGDHFHIASVEEVLKNNPSAVVVSNSGVAKLLAEKNIPCTVVGDTQFAIVAGIKIEGFGKDHAIIYGEKPPIENTGYFVAEKFYFPGDAFHDPKRPIDILALPTAGPWMKMSEAIDFAKQVKPRVAFPVHDGMIVPTFTGFVASMIINFLQADNIVFTALEIGESKEF